MKAIKFLFNFLENTIDKSLSKNKQNFQELNLKSKKIESLKAVAENSNSQLSRIKSKFNLNWEYQFRVNSFNEVDVW